MSLLGTYFKYKIIYNFQKPFTKWSAYKLGLIDENGDIIKKAETKKEKAALDPIINLVRKVKKILVKYIGDRQLVNLLISGYLITESKENILDLEVLIENQKIDVKDKDDKKMIKDINKLMKDITKLDEIENDDDSTKADKKSHMDKLLKKIEKLNK
jgi:hypothetical protein